MEIVLKQLNIKYKNIISYYFKINSTVKQFKKVLKHIFIKYLID